MPPLLTLRAVRLALGSSPLLDRAELAVSAGDRLCLVGRNGSGKSTLLRVAAGTLRPDDGERFLQPGATVRYLPQEPDLSAFATTLDVAQSGLGPGDDPYRAISLLTELGLTGSEPASRLSGGEARRAALAAALAPAPDILLLDEPTNHLDLPAIAWLEETLAGLRCAVVLISHDRRLLETVGRAVVWLDRGATRRMERGFAAFDGWRDEVVAEEERAHHKLARKINAEEDWLRYGVTARRKRNVKRLADLHTLRAAYRNRRGPLGEVRLDASEADRSGRQVIVAEDVSVAFAGRSIVGSLSTRILRGDRVGIIGPNGAGKTTLLNVLTGRRPPDTGRVQVGAALAIETLDQRRDSLDPAATLADTLSGRPGGDQVHVGGTPRHVIGYMKDFLFAPEQARTPVGVLSGGERGRLALAVALARPSNLLVLDEPTNDLDLETLDLLQDLLGEYAGTVLLVSHDRDFLDRVCTSVIAAEGDGRWIEYAGGYSDMLAQRGEARAVGLSRPELRAAAPRVRNGPAGKLSFKDKYALETLPARMTEIERDIARTEALLADPGLYRRDPRLFNAHGSALAVLRTELTAAEERWLELELRREEVEAR